MVIGLITGSGYRLCGQRRLTEEEYRKWKKHFPKTKEDLYIATHSLTILWFPIYPRETVIYASKVGWGRFFGYTIIPHEYYPANEKKTYWPHVKSTWVFWVWPVILLLFLFYLIISKQFKELIIIMGFVGISMFIIFMIWFATQKIKKLNLTKKN